MIKITDNDLCDMIDNYFFEHAYCPTVQDIIDRTPLQSKSSVYSRLRTLKKRKLVTYVETQPRTIVTTKMKGAINELQRNYR